MTNSDAVRASGNKNTKQFTLEQLNVLAGQEIKRYQDTGRVERLKISSITDERQ